ncbi:MAG: cation transporter [Planctomycetes bacterium]|nr:cation transporter [Planctomycetota bacterium]MCB9905066.1 cation transporter [Planctomycetota bacterium]
MKFAPILLVLAALALGYVALGTGGRDAGAWKHPGVDHLTGDVPAGHQVLRFEVEGMCCEGCPEKLDEWLAAVEGVTDSAVSFEQGQAEAVVPIGFDPAPLLSALNQDKYTARLAK